MLLQRARAPVGFIARSSGSSTTALNPSDSITAALKHLSLRPVHLTSVRHATHAAQGRANGPKNGPGKRLGAKKTGDQFVIPGNIIYRQRGTVWHPGANVGMGRDHTIFALEEGFVKYYRDPRRHPKRQYIGVTFARDDTLPVNPTAPRQRRLGLLAAPRQHLDDTAVRLATETPSIPPGISKRARTEMKRRIESGRLPAAALTMRSDYSFRETNWSIGRTADRAGVKVTMFKKGDRFAAWRKRAKRKADTAEKRAMMRKQPSKRAGKRKA